MVSITTLAVALFALKANAATQTVWVGGASPTFTPSELTGLEKGDVVEFNFNSSSSHNVVAGDYSNACQPATSGGFFSGTIAGASTDWTTFSVTIDETDPIPFYCAVPGHCRSGMNGIINPNNDESLSSYRAAASSAAGASAPASVFGGVVGTAGAAATTATTASSTDDSTTTGAASTTGTATGAATGTTTGTSGGSGSSATTTSAKPTASGNSGGRVEAGLGMLMAGAVVLAL
ncbi:hypothetical protein BX600DRAFT_511134 [Xylariales sp. PMI_506]|nr:hypothetical protein BX600DRAFT_511134 [Xylariales sp. PMI_506]